VALTWYLTAAWQPTSNDRTTLEVRCADCARRTLRSIEPAPAEVVAWLDAQGAACVGRREVSGE
jgi:hypothetical protein